jgi:hypothetical protein
MTTSYGALTILLSLLLLGGCVGLYRDIGELESDCVDTDEDAGVE